MQRRSAVVYLATLIVAIAACQKDQVTAPSRAQLFPGGPRRSLFRDSSGQRGLDIGNIGRASDSAAIIARIDELLPSWAMLEMRGKSDSTNPLTKAALNRAGVATMQRDGISVLGKIPFWNTTTDSVVTYVSQFVDSFPSINYWVYGNEDSSTSSTWSRYLDHLAAVDSLLATRGKVHVVGELAGDESKWLNELTAMIAKAPHAQVASVHYYGRASLLNVALKRLDSTLFSTAHGNVGHLWLTEFSTGFPDTANDSLSVLIDSVFTLMNDAGHNHWQRSFYYSLCCDTTRTIAAHTQLLDPFTSSHAPRETFYTFKRITRGCDIACSVIYRKWSQNDLLYTRDSTEGSWYYMTDHVLYAVPPDHMMGTDAFSAPWIKGIWRCAAYDTQFGQWRHYLSDDVYCKEHIWSTYTQIVQEYFYGYISLWPITGMGLTAPIYAKRCQDNGTVLVTTDTTEFQTSTCYQSMVHWDGSAFVPSSDILGYTWKNAKY